MNNLHRHIVGPSLQAVWVQLLEELLRRSEHRPAPRGHATREILGVTLRVNDLRNNIICHPVRKLNPKFMVAEWLWVAFGLEDLATLTQYNGQMSRFSDDGQTLAGAYGPRLTTQWDYVIETLRRDPDSRQAVATIWTPSPAPSKDIPCTISLQFLARDRRLNLIVTMRSSDAWLGIPYDVFTFSQLAIGIAGVLKLQPGFIQMQLASSHLYEDNVVKAFETINTPAVMGIRSPRVGGLPPCFLADVLVDPTHPWSPALAEVWQTYARVLGAETWKEAYRLLGTLQD